MTTIELTLPKPHKLQRAILRDKARFIVVRSSRRVGKTHGARTWLFIQALQKPNSLSWWVSPTYAQSKETYRYYEALLRGIPNVIFNGSDLRITLPNGSEIFIKSAQTPDNLRGAGLDYVVLDEAGYMKPEIWGEIIRPMLVTTNGRAMLLSTPNGRNWFYRIWLRCEDDNEPDWSGHHYTVYDAPRTLISMDEIEDIKRNTTERVFSAEFMAEFLEGGGAVFRNLTACIGTPEKVSDDIVFGVDWGKSNDYTVITVIDRRNGHVLEIDRFNQIGWALQRARLMALYEKYQPRTIYAEKNSIGDPNIEALQDEGLPVYPFTTTASSKSRIINDLALAFEQNDITIPSYQPLLNELQAFTVQQLPSGNWRYTAPAGLHDDCVLSLAIAWYGALSGGTFSIFA